MKEKFKNLDFYGEGIHLTYKGVNKYKTSPGAVTSLIVIIVLTAYAGYKCYNLVNKINPNVSKQSFIRGLSKDPSFKPGEYGFDLAFGIGTPLDP